MKKLLLAALLYAATWGVASAATANASAASFEGAGDPFGVPVYVRGGFNDWGLAAPMAYDAGSGTYSATISLDPGSYEFKVASEDWSTVDLGNLAGASAISTFPTTVAAEVGAFNNFVLEIASSGLYSFTLDVDPFTGNGGPYDLTVAQVIPIPAAGWLFITALGALGFLRRR